MVRNCQLSDLIYLTASRGCLRARTLVATVAGFFFVASLSLLSFVENAFDSLRASRWLASGGGGKEELGWL